MEEKKEVELRSRRRKFIYNRTFYHPVGLNKVSHFSRRGRAPITKQTTDEEIKIFVKGNTES